MNCPACGKDTVDGAAFCQHCGARLGGCCPICGNPIVENALFCQCCGARLDAVKPAPAPVFVPAPAQGQADEPCKAAEEVPGPSAFPVEAEAVPPAGQPAAGAPEEPVAQAPQADGPGAADAQGMPPVPEGRMAITGGNLTNWAGARGQASTLPPAFWAFGTPCTAAAGGVFCCCTVGWEC